MTVSLKVSSIHTEPNFFRSFDAELPHSSKGFRLYLLNKKTKAMVSYDTSSPISQQKALVFQKGQTCTFQLC